MRAFVVLAVLAFGMLADAGAEERVLDDFDDPAAWTLAASDDVNAALRFVDGPHGHALCIDYDFGTVTGYVSAHRALAIAFPPRYAMATDVRGDAPANTLQFKLIDAGGENVWWAQRPDFRFPRDWQTQRFLQREIDFAWGPAPDRTLRQSAAIELAIASGSGGGSGSACFGHLALRRLADTPAADEPREFGALTLRWPAERGPARYDIELSDEGARWRAVRRIEGARGDVHEHWLPESEARFVRVVAAAAPPPAIEIHDDADANAFFARIAKQSRRGQYPRAFVGEQSYWTVFGVDGAAVAALMGEDGAIEPRPGVGALEPFLVVDGRIVSWADAAITHTLRDGDLPMPTTHWRADDLALDITAFAAGTPTAARALVRYALINRGRRARAVTLALAWRPFQVNPPTQFLARRGGAVATETMAWDGHLLSVNGAPQLLALTPPSNVRIEPAAAGDVTSWLDDAPPRHGARSVRDADGFASAALSYALVLRPGQARVVDVALPITAGADDLRRTAAIDVRRETNRVATQWRAKVDRIGLTGPAEVADIARTLRTALAHILVNRSGAALQPGARAYARSWIRDGALTSLALLRLGHDDAARDFLRWFAPFQFKSGKVPCCASARGADPVPENDSDGEFVFAAASVWRYSHDVATARAMWPHVAAAIAHLDSLRNSERTEANRLPERAAYFGLLPPSISHEGYADKPAYSYWDDFWGYIGYCSAVELAAGLGLTDETRRIASRRDEFLVDLRASLAVSATRFGLDVLPGSADRGDVDPTSSTIALSPGGLLGTLPDALVRKTFERYWRSFDQRRADEAAGVRNGDGGYTPYEWRTVGALVRLGERERAEQVMAYLYRDRRPAGWNQWAEVVLRDSREPRFLGDMPHGWVASDHIRSVLDVFAYEDEGAHALVLAAGVPASWLRGRGVAIRDLRTPYGLLSWRARRSPGRAIDVTVTGLRMQPPGGMTLRGPWGADATVWVDGRRRSGRSDAIALTHTPTRIRIEPR